MFLILPLFFSSFLTKFFSSPLSLSHAWIQSSHIFTLKGSTSSSWVWPLKFWAPHCWKITPLSICLALIYLYPLVILVSLLCLWYLSFSYLHCQIFCLTFGNFVYTAHTHQNFWPLLRTIDFSLSHFNSTEPKWRNFLLLLIPWAFPSCPFSLYHSTGCNIKLSSFHTLRFTTIIVSLTLTLIYTQCTRGYVRLYL